MTRLIALAMLVAAIAPAAADETSARTCAGKLGKDARQIYDAVVPGVTPSANLRDLVTAKTRELVIGGKINRSVAEPAALAAGECLKQLRQ